MAISGTQLIQAVALRMDEVTPDGAITGTTITVDGADNNPLYGLIAGIMNDGVQELFSVAPYWRLPQTEFDQDDEVEYEALDEGDNPRYRIRLKVPENFLRVAEISFDLFKRPITEVFPEQSPMGRRQHNRFLMAREAKPVAVISHGLWEVEGDEPGADPEPVPCREIDCYSFEGDPTDHVLEASYIAKPVAIATDTANVEKIVPEVLIPALEWLIAAHAFGARGDANHAAICQQYAQNLIM